MRTRAAAAALAPVLVAAACLPGSGPALAPYQDDAAAPPIDLGGDGGLARQDVDLGPAFALGGLAPSHGPWTGGTRALLRGRGFGAKLRVWIGGVELAPSDVVASSTTSAAVLTPPGTPGPADVTLRDDATAQTATLPAGFFYDAFVVEPSKGSTTGGTRVTLEGRGTAWSDGTSVTFAGKPCVAVDVRDATHLACTTPSNAAAVVDVSVTTPDGAVAQAREAYTYADSDDGYRGGLSGGALAGSLKVLVFDGWVGVPLPGAYVIAGTRQTRADAKGIATFADPSLTGAVTVTIAAKCHQPLTFVGVPVDTVTAYVDPKLDPDCAMGDPPSGGNYGGPDAGAILGELLWPGIELKRGDWTGVPAPVRASERRAAYAFLAHGSPSDTFQLPAADAATTPDSPGTLGYSYGIPNVSPGNVSVYALAGIEDRSASPPRFTAYVMGVARGVSVAPQTKVVGVDIPMTTLLDHAVTIAPQPPAPGARGPDRLVTMLAVTLAQSQYAIVPTGAATTPLPLSGNVTLSGLPALDGALAGERYVLGAAAVTGASWAYPASIVGQVATTDANDAVTIGGFLPVPVIDHPAAGEAWGGTELDLVTGGSPSLVRVDVRSGGGLVRWTVVAPGAAAASPILLPDLSKLPDGVGLARGPIGTTVYSARISGFDYGQLRYGQLGTSGWDAYALDATLGSY